MLACQLMSQPVAFCYTSDNLEQAARLMWETDCGALPIIDLTGRPVAMLTDRDICMAAYTQGKPLRELDVSTAMSKSLQTCSMDDTLEDAEQLMVQHQIRRLPVLDRDGQLLGILSLNDLARAANQQHPAAPDGSYEVSLATAAKTLAAVCHPRCH